MSLIRKISSRLLIVAAGVTALISTFENAHAIDLYGFGSYWDQKDGDGVWGGGGGIALPLFTEHLRLDGRAYYFENSTIGRNGNIELVPIDLGVQIHILPDRLVDPYILGGGTYIYADSSRYSTDNNFGGYAGAGIDLGLIKILKPFVEVLYRQAEIDTSSSINEKFDASGITVNTGLKLHF